MGLLRPYLQGSAEGANSRCVFLHTAVQVGILQQYKECFVNWRQKAQIRSTPFDLLVYGPDIL